MSSTTTYEVKLRYLLDNKAGKEAENLAHKLGDVSHAGAGVGSVLGHIGALAGGVFGIHGAYEALVKFNSEVENAKISLTAMVEGGFGGSFEWARGQAEAMYSEFQKFSTQTPMTTREMMEFGRATAMAVTGAGGGIKDIIEVTERGAVAAKAWGFESSMASLQLSEMLQGNIRNTEAFTKAMALAGHKTLEELRAMTAQQRLEWAKETFKSPAMMDAVKTMSQSFSGVTSTLIDKLQIMMGKIGLPLFQAITAEVGRWNEWIDKNGVAIDHMAQTVAQGLVTAFEDVKAAFAFIYDHADTFLAIGKVWAAIKVGNMLGGGLLGGGGGLGGMLGNLGSSVSSLSVGQVMGPLMFAGVGAYEIAKAAGLDEVGHNLGMALADIKTGGLASEMDRVTKSTMALDQAFADAATRMGGDSAGSRLQGSIDDWHNQSTALQAYLDALKESQGNDPRKVNQDNADAAAEKLRAMGIDTSLGPEALASMLGLAKSRESDLTAQSTLAGTTTSGLMALLENSAMTEYQRQTLNEVKAQGQVFGYINQHLAKGIPINVTEILDILRGNTADPEGKHKAITEKPKVNVTIHRIEVQSDDPDRFAFALVESFRDAAKNPSSAVAALREG